MILDFCEMLILDMLTVDDEPLNLVLSEAIVNDDSKQYIKPPYNNYKVQLSQIKDALKRLIKFNMIIILDETGEQLDISINDVLKSPETDFFWFRVTESGKSFFYENYHEFWKE